MSAPPVLTPGAWVIVRYSGALRTGIVQAVRVTRHGVQVDVLEVPGLRRGWWSAGLVTAAVAVEREAA